MGPRPNRQSTRLRGYDYSSEGAYFVTLVTYGGQCLFGEVVEGEMRRNPVGDLAAQVWLETPETFGHVELDEWVVMPNHVHGILRFLKRPGIARDDVGQFVGTRPGSLGAVVQRFKSVATSRIRAVARGSQGVAAALDPSGEFTGRIWQRNFYDHIVRDDESLNRIRDYIHENPRRWAVDKENPANHRGIKEPLDTNHGRIRRRRRDPRKP